jgi:hypothetical protein
MAYNIMVEGNTIKINDGSTDKSTDLTLIGKNYSGFGQALNENFIKLLENFSTETPLNPIKGQLWYDSKVAKLKVYSGSGFVPVSSTTVSTAPPLNMGIGDMWYNSTTKQLSFWDGSSVILLGPTYTAAQQKSGISVYTVKDKIYQDHVITCIYNNSFLVGFFANESFTLYDPLSVPGSSPDGFVRVGFNQGTISDFKFNISALDSEKLGGVLAIDYFRSGRENVTDSKITIDSNDGLSVKVANLRVGTDNTVILENSMNGQELDIRVKYNYNSENAIQIKGSNRSIDIGSSGAPYQMNLYQAPSISSSVTNKSYVDNTVKANTVMLCIVIDSNTTGAQIIAIVEAMAPASEYPINTPARVLCSYANLATPRSIKVYRVSSSHVWQPATLENVPSI